MKYDIAQTLGIAPNTSTMTNFSMSNFFIKDGNLFIAGLIKNPSPTSNSDLYQYCYWKNGVKTVVFEQHDYQTSASMHLIGNDVYVPLQNNITVSTTAPTTWDLGYYKNGVYNFVNTLSGYSDVHEDGGVLKMLVLDSNNQTVYYKNLLTGVVTPAPSFITFANSYYYHQTDNNDKYIIGSTYYYKNNIQHNLYSPGNNFKFLNDFKALDGNIYKILHTDDNTGYNFNVYINDVIVQSATNNASSTNSSNTQFLSLTVVPN